MTHGLQGFTRHASHNKTWLGSIFKVFVAIQVSGSKFVDIDLSDQEFAEYDEKASCPVGISNHRFSITK